MRHERAGVSVDYSIVVPAYNEERLLAATLGELKEAMAGIALAGELIVVDNNSSDRTADIARAAGARVAFEPVNQISRARNRGARAAAGRYLVFVDAYTRIAPELLGRAIDNLASGRCCGGGATVAFDTELNRTARLALAFWNWMSRTLRVSAGCFLYCRREDFERCGGFSEKVYASEEIWLSRALRRIGRREGRAFCIIDAPRAVSSGRKFLWYGYWQQLGFLAVFALFPLAVRYKRLCGVWYKRPGVGG